MTAPALQDDALAAEAAPQYTEPLDVAGFHVTFVYETSEYKCFRVYEDGLVVGLLRVVWTAREVFTPHERAIARRDEIHNAVGEAVAARCFI